MKERDRLPYPFLPQWFKQRIEVNVYNLYAFMEELGASLSSDTRVLDAGAGEGRFSPELSHARYVAVDLAVGDVTWDYKNNLDVIGDLIRLPFEDDVFDVVVCTQVLEHVPEPFLVLAELSRVLKPGGKLVLSAPQSWHQHQKPYDFYRYTSFGLRYLIEKAGLCVESIEPMGGYFWFLSFQLQNINYWLFPKGMRGRCWTWPLRGILALFFQVIFPLLLFYLDPLDQIKDETFGYICAAVKPMVNAEP